MIKVCGITDTFTAGVAVEAGATAIGVVFAESPRRVSLRTAEEILAGLPAGVERIGVFRRKDLDQLPVIFAHLDLDAIQVHGADALPLKIHGHEIIPAARVEHAGGFRHGRVLVDSPAGEGSGVGWKFELVHEHAKGKSLILAGGLTPDNVGDAVEKARPYGVDVSSGVESERGRKDHTLIRAFIQNAKEALNSIGAGQ